MSNDSILSHSQVSVIGGVPVMLKTSDMSNTIPDEKTVITFLTYLCARLLSIRNEQHAATVIQLAWRRYQSCCNPTVSILRRFFSVIFLHYLLSKSYCCW